MIQPLQCPPFLTCEIVLASKYWARSLCTALGRVSMDLLVFLKGEESGSKASFSQ